MKVSIFLTFIIAGLGQWMFAYVLGLRRVFRLWSSILFKISGGLIMFWRVGWYELLVGAAWFPWCFALYLRALQDHGWVSIARASVPIFMIISTGGGYYPIYLLVSMGIIALMTLFRAKTPERWQQLRATAFVVMLSAALSAVVIIPYLDTYHYTSRDVAPDQVQYFSQPIQYGLINYIINTQKWFDTSVLGTAGGWNWFYIGWLPVAALALVPLAYSRTHRQRWAMAASGILFLILMMWFANRFSPFKQIYDWVPFLYSLRFPNRLLVIAASPLLILSSHALEYTYRLSRAGFRNVKLFYSPSRTRSSSLPAHYAVTLLWIIGLIVTTREVYKVNKEFAFLDQSLNSKSFDVLKWLKNYDPSLYYVNIGGGVIYWDWTPAAYTLEMPVINFQYSRYITSRNMQSSESSPFIASAKYQISLPDQPHPENAQKLREFDGVDVWYIPDGLPYAFSVKSNLIHPYNKLALEQVMKAGVKINGPNQVVVKDASGEKGDALVVLTSYYPGWKLLIDGKPAQVTPYNGYLGSKMLPGEHSYTFYYLPGQYIVGATISMLTLVLIATLALYSPIKLAAQRIRQTRVPAVQPGPVL